MSDLLNIVFGRDILCSDFTKEYIKRMKKNKFNSKIIKSRDIQFITEPAFFLSLCYLDGAPLKLSDFQIAVINSKSKFMHLVKCRQLGWSSICCAGRALALSHLYKNYHSIFISYNLREAKEKIEAVRMLYEGIPAVIKRKMVQDYSLGVKFDNGSWIYSLFNPRGFSKADIYLDEMAFYEDQDKVYNASVPIIARFPEGQLKIGSSPFGKIGKFYEIFINDKGRYSSYERHIWYWWDSEYYCHNVPLARANASYMPTEERVEKFGTPILKEIFYNMSQEDFQQEFEACFADENLSFFPYDLIRSRMNFYSEDMQEVFPQKLEEIAYWQKGILYAGYDVGRYRNTSEFFVFDKRENKGKMKLVQVFHRTLKNSDFKEQEDFLRCFISLYHHVIGCIQIDKTGLGLNLAENLSNDYPNIVNGVVLTNTTKERLAVNVKMSMAQNELELFPDTETIRQIHSIKQKVLPSGKLKFDTEKNEKHHADRFWAIALALDGVYQEEGIRPQIIFF